MIIDFLLIIGERTFGKSKIVSFFWSWIINRKTVLVLGATGMLGSMVYSYLKRQTSLDVTGTSRVATRELIGFDAYKFTLDKENLLD